MEEEIKKTEETSQAEDNITVENLLAKMTTQQEQILLLVEMLQKHDVMLAATDSILNHLLELVCSNFEDLNYEEELKEIIKIADSIIAKAYGKENEEMKEEEEQLNLDV